MVSQSRGFEAHYCGSPGCTRRGQLEHVKHEPAPSYRGVSPRKVHNCGSPGCTRRGEVTVAQTHNCGSPGCTRRGQTEYVKPALAIISELKIDRPAPLEPDPYNFRILEIYSNGSLTLARVRYSDCTNYEGEKILLMRKTLREVHALGALDPHFLDKSDNGLIARFIPTREGWELGMSVLKSI